MPQCHAPDCVTPTDRALCDPCIRWGIRTIGLLADDYRDLGAHIGATSRHAAVPIRTTPGARLPLSLGVDELQRRIWWLALAWDIEVRDRAGFAPLPDWEKRRRPWVAVTASVRSLVRSVPQLAQIVGAEMWTYPGAVEAHTVLDGWVGVVDLARCHEHALRLLGLTDPTPERIHGVECPTCGCDALLREFETVRCPLCGCRMSPEEYERWTRTLVEQVA